MAISKLCFLTTFLLLAFVTQAQLGGIGRSRRQFGTQQQRCQIDRLNALRPNRRVESEAGVTEYYDESEDQLDCAGVSVLRNRIEPNGLLLPSYSNSPSLIYILQGRGITGAVISGCPESFQDIQQSEGRFSREGRGERGERSERAERGTEQMFRDEHQRITHFRQGDILAVPAGVPHWCYNDGPTPVEAIVVSDTSNIANQLDKTSRLFLLAGKYQEGRGRERYRRGHEEEQENSGNNVLSGFDSEMLAEAIGVSRETVRKLQGENDKRGHIVRVERRLQLLRPSRGEEREERESARGEEREERESARGEEREERESARGEEREERESARGEEREERESARGEERGERGERGCEDKVVGNGFDESICSMKMRENIGDPMKADVYKPNGGRITFLNSQKLPILRFIQMSANRGVLHRNAILAPHWNINAHAIVYVTNGRARMQVVSNEGQRAFDGELRRGQLLVIPQNFALMLQARSEGFSWISFQTNDNAMNTPIVGKTSVLRGIPVDVLANSYRGMSREEARRVKFNRGQETSIFTSEGSRGRRESE